MRRAWQLIKSQAGATIIAILTAWGIVSLFVPARILIEIGDAFAIPMSAAAFWVYGKSLLRRAGRAPDYIDLLILGVFGGWLTNCLDRSLRLFARLFDASLANSWMVGFLLTMLTCFAALHVLVKGSDSDARHRFPEGWRTIRLALIAGCVLAVVIVWFDLSQR